MAYTRINWQNEPSEATALNSINLNKMDSTIYDHDQRLDTDEASLANKVDKVAGKGLSTNDYTDADKAIVDGVTTALAGKVDKEAGKGLSSNDYTTAEKNKLAGISANAKNVSISDTLADGTVLANITIDGTTTAIKGSDIDVDDELSPTSTNPVENKAIYDALNNLLPSKTVSGNPISISDASGLNAKALKVTLNPIQDLHGYPNPWVGGAGKNKLPITLTEIKQRNTAGTWTDNKYVYRDVTVTVNTNENDDYITSISFSGTISQVSSFVLCEFYLPAGTYKANGCNFGSRTTTRLLFQNISTSAVLASLYSGQEDVEFTIESQTQVRCYFVIANDQTSGTFYPMIRLSTVTDATFAPYSNICPISGRTEASVVRTGKNLVDISAIEQGGLDENTGEETTSTSVKRSPWIKVLPNDTLYWNGAQTRFYFYKADKTYISRSEVITNTTITTLNDCGYIRLQASNNNWNIPDLQLEQGTTATTYEPYTAETHTHQYGQTVYGGEDDFVNGGATVTLNTVAMGDLTYTSGPGYVQVSKDNIQSVTGKDMKRTNNAFVISSIWDVYQTVNSVRFATNLTPEAFKTLVTGQTLCYELATPTTIQTSAEDISLLKGNNVLSTNADDMELKYSVSLDSLLP